MQPEEVREVRRVIGEEEINAMLATGKWRVLSLDYDDEQIKAVMARVRA